jgi:hypothetical protein
MYTNLPKTIQDSDIKIFIENYEIAYKVLNSIKNLELTKYLFILFIKSG